MEAIVTDTATALSLDIAYLWGHPLEISERLDQLAKMPAKAAKKYPLVCLFTDIPETRGADVKIEAEVKLHLIIAVSTLARYTTQERFTLNFEPKLYPIYEELLKQICWSGYYAEGYPAKLQHTKTDRFRYGKTGIYANTGEIFKDRIDCIEIENLQLSMIHQECKLTSNLTT